MQHRDYVYCLVFVTNPEGRYIRKMRLILRI